MQDKPRLSRDIAAPQTGIVHLGPGAFFRAFNAVYTDEVIRANGGYWGILAVSLRSITAREQLAPQSCVYTSVTLSEDAENTNIINAITDVLVASEDPNAVVLAMANPDIKIVSLTITEKGYCHEPSTGALNFDHIDIAHDLRNPKTPRSAVGFIVAALAVRKAAGHRGFTVLSCDNLPSNGALAKGTVLEFAHAIDPELSQWIALNTSFPATMVDRITPATTQTDVSDLARATQYYDPACVVHEEFRQWVIEDNFVSGRPEWEQVGAQMVASVEEHELMKLRCLNGTHSTLAYLGYLAGHETISDCAADPNFAALCKKLWHDEIIPVVTTPEGEDLNSYCAALLTRYRDTSIRHRTWQIAMDGSQKLPQRILGTIADNLEKGRVPYGLCLAVAGWMRYVGGVDEAGAQIDVRDPLAARLKAASDTADDKVTALLQFEDVFGTDLPANRQFRNALKQAYEKLVIKGASAAVKEYIDK